MKDFLEINLRNQDFSFNSSNRIGKILSSTIGYTLLVGLAINRKKNLNYS